MIKKKKTRIKEKTIKMSEIFRCTGEVNLGTHHRILLGDDNVVQIDKI